MNRMGKGVEERRHIGWMMVTSIKMMMMMIIRWWDLPHAWHCSPALIGWQQNWWARVQLHQHWASDRVVIIPTLIINWAGQWLGQGGFSTTGQTNIECDICPGLMSRILCFCNRIHIVHIEKQAGQGSILENNCSPTPFLPFVHNVDSTYYWPSPLANAL